jgi:hypothetical protein
MAANPFKVTIYDKAFRRLGWITDPIACKLIPRWLALGTASFTLRTADPSLRWLYQDGARITVEYRGEFLYSGQRGLTTGPIIDNGEVTLRFEDDWIFTSNLAWIAPRHPISPTSLGATDPNALGQAYLPGGGSDAGPDGTVVGQHGYLLWPDGSAAVGFENVASTEEAVKWLLQANADRLGVPLVTLPDQGRGLTGEELRASLPVVRMSTIAEAIVPMLQAAGLGVRIWHQPGTDHLSAEIVEPRASARILTPRSGIVTGGQWSIQPPTVTRNVVGGPGELAARVFRAYGRPDLEAQYGMVRERFREATGSQLEWPDDLGDEYKVPKYYHLRSDVPAGDKTAFEADMQAAGTKGLNEGQAVTGLSMELSETASFHMFGADGYHLGDPIGVKAHGLIFQDRITEAELELRSSGEFTVKPTVGERTDDPNRQLAKAIAALAEAQRRVNTSR